MFCRSCGVQNAETANYCVGCGATLNLYAAPRAAGGDLAGVAPGFAGYAGFWKRVGAYLIDVIVTMVIGGVLGFVWGMLYVLAFAGDSNSIGNSLGGGVLGMVTSWLYFTLLESSAKQATLGKQALGIIVTDMEGQRISFAKANGRYFGKIISSIILGIGYIMAGTTERKQGLHDIMAGTLVVNQG